MSLFIFMPVIHSLPLPMALFFCWCNVYDHSSLQQGHPHIAVLLADLLREPGLVSRLRGGELAEVMFLILAPDAVSPPQQTGSLFSDA